MAFFEPHHAAQSAARNFSIGEVKGRRVIDASGDNVGTIEDVVIEAPWAETSRGLGQGGVEPTTWRVSGFVVSLTRDVAERLGVQRKGLLDAARIEIGAERVRTVGENVILNIDRDVIAQALRERAVTAPQDFSRAESTLPAADRDGLYGPGAAAPTSAPERFEPPPF